MPLHKFMPLRQLVNYFNDLFAREHQPGIRPLVLKNGQVTGLLDSGARIGSRFAPVRQTSNNYARLGHIAQIIATPGAGGPQDEHVMTLADVLIEAAGFQGLINLDRFCRTVHMLNYLQYAGLGGVLFVDVDPRHVLSVRQDHGAYFEDIIIKCGLAVTNIVISVAVANADMPKPIQLLEGLGNYQQRGYRIALTLGDPCPTGELLAFIAELAPDYLRVDAPVSESGQADALDALKELQAIAGSRLILQQVDQRNQAYSDATAGVDLVQGRYYDKLSMDYLRCLCL